MLCLVRVTIWCKYTKSVIFRIIFAIWSTLLNPLANFYFSTFYYRNFRIDRQGLGLCRTVNRLKMHCQIAGKWAFKDRSPDPRTREWCTLTEIYDEITLRILYAISWIECKFSLVYHTLKPSQTISDPSPAKLLTQTT